MLDRYDKSYLTPKEVGRELGISEQIVRYRLRTGSMPGIKLGASWYVAKEWLAQPNNLKVAKHV